MKKFSIFYNDGTVIHGGGEDDELVPVYFSRKWLEAPADGVCVVNVENSNTGTTAFQESEFYFQMPHNFHGQGDIFASNKIGVFLRQACDVGSLVKFGGWTAFSNYREMAKKARLDNWTPRVCGKCKEPEESADM